MVLLLLAATLSGLPAAASPARAACAAPTSVAGYRSAIDALGYTGFDGGFSTATPYGIAWTTGDSVKDGALYPNNLFLQRTSGCWQVLTNAVPVASDGTFHWLLASTWDGSRLRVTALHGERTATGWNTLGTDIATFKITSTSLVYEGLASTPASADGTFAWVSALTTTGGYHYLYGAANDAFGCNKVYVARIPAGRLTTPSAWTYWDGSTWNTSRSAAADVHQNGLCWSAGFSVRYNGTAWTVVGKDGGFGSNVVQYSSARPVGPWTASPSLLTLDGSTTYLAMAHPEATLSDGKTLVSWSVSGGIIQFGEVTLP